MKQVLVRKGRALVADVPRPGAEAGRVVVRVSHSMISSGTEVSILQESGRNLAARALDRPDLVRQTIESVRQQGLARTVSKVVGRMTAGVAVGYSCAGTVLETGAGVDRFRVGDRVACGGGGFATHSEIVSVPKNLVVPVPAACSLEDASSVTIGAIALQGVRRADPRLGDVVVVIGLGLLGQLTVQILKANGCRVLALDLDRDRMRLAKELGADRVLDGSDPDVVRDVLHESAFLGADAVVITASTASSDVVQQAMQMCRKKGRVVVVGSVGMDVQRSPFYEKEIDFLISCSYGPGRYDERYESDGIDYPFAYVRWTENRNMDQYLRLVADGRVRVAPLIERTVDLDDAPAAFEALTAGPTRPLAAVIRYPVDEIAPPASFSVPLAASPKGGGRAGVAVVGAGAFARSMHLPNLSRLGDLARLSTVVSGTGANAAAAAAQFGAARATTRLGEALAAPDVDAVLLTTRHDRHASETIAALETGKHVFCEKPLALREEDLDRIFALLGRGGPVLMVGFNRRFSPAAVAARDVLRKRANPAMILYRVNAGYVPPDSWIHGPEGGGRVVGEACHMLDLFEFLLDSAPASLSVESARASSAHVLADDNFSCAIRYEDGSVAQLFYTALGPKSVEKEKVEIFFDGKSLLLDDFRQLTFSGSRKPLWKALVPDKGHLEALRSFFRALREGSVPPIPYESIERTSRLAIRLAGVIDGNSG